MTLNPAEIFVLTYLQLGGPHELGDLEHELTAGEGFRVEAVRGAVAYLRRNRFLTRDGAGRFVATETGSLQLRRELARADAGERARYGQAFADQLIKEAA
jgi:hypothetical protein